MAPGLLFASAAALSVAAQPDGRTVNWATMLASCSA
jgi:hypothetical protein